MPTNQDIKTLAKSTKRNRISNRKSFKGYE
jgi:hypothetical protein